MKIIQCVCDICNEEITPNRQYALGYQFKSYVISNPKYKHKMDICSDCMDKFKAYVKSQQ